MFALHELRRSFSMNWLYLTIGIILGVAGIGMLLLAMTSSPILKKNRLERRRQAAENHRPEEYH
ncbi:hypothetical protein H7K37_15595 [Brevibacillus brevis]|nr:hypothetical protein [Brevibacillus brevis]MCE0450931.1 hypothetical protein [Brevibacillus sp. AF8]UKK99737.1 hypothetical protein FO446_20950 [Brevibacillus brevis]